jgi:hypothetical protein
MMTKVVQRRHCNVQPKEYPINAEKAQKAILIVQTNLPLLVVLLRQDHRHEEPRQNVKALDCGSTPDCELEAERIGMGQNYTDGQYEAQNTHCVSR